MALIDSSKTVLPSIEHLNYKDNAFAGCMLSEVIPFECTCGIDFTIIGYEISNEFLKGSKTFNQIAIKYKLNGCCRMRLLSPFTTNVVSMDINAKVNETKDGLDIVNVSAPNSIFNIESFHPPSLS